MTNILAFPLHRARLPESDETWCVATERAIEGRRLSRAELATLLERIAVYRSRHPEAQPGSAPWPEFLEFRRQPEGVAR